MSQEKHCSACTVYGHHKATIEVVDRLITDSVASSVYTVITAVISRLNTHCSTDPPQEYTLNSTAVIFHLKNTYSVIQYNYTVIISRDHT